MKVSDLTNSNAVSLSVRGDHSWQEELIGPNIKRHEVKNIPSKSMEAILDDLRKSFGQYSQKSLSLNIPIEDFVQIRDGNQILGVNRDGYVAAIDISSDKIREKHYSHAFTGIVANSSETQAFLLTQEGWIVALDISDIFRLRIMSQVQCFNHPVDAIRILSSDLLIAYDFNGIIETFRFEDSQILKVEYIEYQTLLNASSMVSPNGKYLLFYNHQSMCVFDRRGNKIYESDGETKNCCLSDYFFAYMIESSEKSKIHVRRLTDPFNLFLTISTHKRDNIARLYLSEDSHYVMGLMNNQSSKIWDLFDQKCEGAIDLETYGLIQLKFGKNRTILYSNAKSFSIDFFLELYAPKSVDLYSPKICIENLHEDKIVISSRNSLMKIDLKTGNTMEFPLSKSTNVTALKHFDENTFFVGVLNNSSHEIRMKSLHSPDNGYERYVLLDSEAVCIEVAKDKHLIFVGCFHGEVVTIETNDLTVQSRTAVEGTPTSLLYTENYGLICGLESGYIQEVGCSESFECHSSSITSLAYSSKGILVSCSSDGRIGIWNSEDLRSIEFLDFPAITIKISKNGQYLYSMSENGVFNCWCLDTLNCLFTEDYSGYHRFFITESERHMVLIDQTSLKIIDGPLMETVRVTGTAKKKDFIEYTRKLISKGTPPEFDEEMENGVILPFMITPIFLYSYLNLAQHLKESLSRGSPIFNSSSRLNPLRIAALTDNGDCFKLLVKSLKRSENSHALSFVNTETLFILNIKFVPYLSKLYDMLFRKSTSTDLPTVVSTSIQMPQFEMSDNKTIQENEFHSKGIKNPQKVVYWESQFKLSSEPKLIEDMGFLGTMLGNNECLTNKFVNKYLDFRWRKIKGMAYFRFLLNFAHLISIAYLLFIDIERKENRSSYINWVIFLSLPLALSEIILIRRLFPYRFFDMQCLLEIARLSAIVVYAISFSDDDDDGSGINILNYITIDVIRINLVFWSFITTIHYFVVFNSTRYIVHLIYFVSVDLRIYLVLLAYTTFCISCVLYILLDSEMNGSSADYFLMAIGLSFANFNVEIFYGKPMTGIFCLLLNTLVMLNLVIAIIGDTYDKIQDERQITNNRALAITIIQTEALMIWKRNKGSPKYFHMCEWDSSSSGKSEWLGRIRELKLILKNQDKNLKETRKSLEQKIESCFKDPNDIQLKKHTDQILSLILTKLK